jgi:BirA family biotin operon repressor/biotin-[acetyl-CoA-carboxylase] ligase
MVNEKENIRTRILELLLADPGSTVSGVRLSELLGVSRVAVWKHIKTLQGSGVHIESGPSGYTLPQEHDLLLPFCFDPPFRDRIFHFPRLGSTMDMARQLAKDNAPHLSVVIADEQTGGRGRLNRHWFSSQGGLWMTVILKPVIPPMMAYIYNFATSLSLSETLRSLFGLEVTVKWPNDLLLNGNKLAGLLSEMETRGDMVEFVNIGIGLNVNNSPQKDEPRAISLRHVLGKSVCRKEIVETFVENFGHRIETLDPGSIIRQWKAVTSTIGSRVRIETLSDVFEGTALDVDESGALIIETKERQKEKIIYGDCFHT